MQIMSSKDRYVGGKQASEIIGVHQRTLYKWADDGKIDMKRTPGGKRMYNVDKYMRDNDDLEIKKNIIYARVSSAKQSEDLTRQVQHLAGLFPDHEIITDIGSGINLDRRGLRQILDLAIRGQIAQVVVAHKDRLARFGYSLIESIIRDYSGGRIIIVDRQEDIEPQEELVEDVLAIMNVFMARMNGLRSHSRR